MVVFNLCLAHLYPNIQDSENKIQLVGSIKINIYLKLKSAIDFTLLIWDNLFKKILKKRVTYLYYLSRSNLLCDNVPKHFKASK